jgi:phospholipase/carboxylesterase
VAGAAIRRASSAAHGFDESAAQIKHADFRWDLCEARAPMREERLAGLTVRLAGGSDREGGGDGPLVVLLHGFGAPGDDLVALWRQLRAPPGTRFAFPQAPLALDPQQFGAGRAWWMIDWAKLEAALSSGETRDLSRDVPEGLAQARARVSELLDELQQLTGASGERTVIGGFSQGAMLACDLTLRSERPLAGLVLMSSTLLAEREWTPRMAARAGLPVLVSHGRSDPLLPFALAEQLRDLLTEAGLKVQWVPFNGGHGIADGVMDTLGSFLTAVLG